MPSRPSRSVSIAMPPLRTTASATAEPTAPAPPVMRMTLSRKRPMRCSRCSRQPYSNIGKTAMAALAGGKARRARGAFALHHAGRIPPFGAQAVHLAKPLLQEDRAAVGAHAALREARDLVRQFLRGPAALAVRHQAL